MAGFVEQDWERVEGTSCACGRTKFPPCLSIMKFHVQEKMCKYLKHECIARFLYCSVDENCNMDLGRVFSGSF